MTTISPSQPPASDAPEAPQRRRASDRRTGLDRRFAFRYAGDERTPPWPEQRAQFLTRFLFWALGVVYFHFNAADAVAPSFREITYVFGVYITLTAAFMAHAYRKPYAPVRWRLAMWLDLAFVSFCVVADKSATVAPAFMAYLAVILGNGMRYSMRLFREAVFGTFFLALIALYIRYADYLEAVNLATVFVLLFGGIVVLYSYALMGRIERAKRRLENEGRIDALTGLLNRRGLREKAEVLFTALARSERGLAVLFADLNKFKAINDQLGHRAGDRVLIQVSELFRRAIRRGDILARYGGDEFVLILPAGDTAKAGILAQRLQTRLREWVREQPFDLSMSIGIAEAPRHGTDLNTVLENVDKAMYRGKFANEDGGGIQCVDDSSPNPRLH